MNNLAIQECSLEDIEVIKYISAKTFCETFEEDNSEEDMANYLKENFSDAQVESEVSNPESQFFIVKDNEEVVAYMKLNVGNAQTEKGHEHALEVQRIYVFEEYKGKGIGGALMQEAIKNAKDKNLEYVWLGVWEHNYSAQKFYEKHGFKKFSEHIFKLGDDEQTDYLMKLML
ncbi:GNAT family N-acetyltransferase [Cellulosilyticum ruminicola]|uniref:GNAT family N-acetyltransferase n=1 Tax=Cellulosilyticum ruminicola TaxID=425254 RepID=UPI0006D0AA15|nr:GNAT family N-acetyltransferase [Cellulosilyticum ruminicola]